MALPARNLLSDETSPYLRQHAENPVNWRPWSVDSLREAVELDKPILLSVGYAACHWCHVMAHESFEDPAVADVMNRLFVNIKVDREERPDIDQIYMAALTAMGEQGGWPLTMTLTPSARPFWGGTYLPRRPRYGMAGVIEVFESIGKVWRERRAEVEETAGKVSAHISQQLSRTGVDGGTIRPDLLPRLAQGIVEASDPVNGGLRGAPKFPNAPMTTTLWLNWLEHRDQRSRDNVLLTLEKMLRGGIYDHVGGGLARYSTDSEWLVPHFEKMLYDNAQLIRLCNWAFAETGDRLFRIRIEETIGWLLREMRDENGFASSLDADSEGEEGRFYTWTEEQLRAIVGNDADAFLENYRLSKPDTWEGDPILHQSGDADPDARHCLDRLLAARGLRVRPARDDKVLVDWNGLAITALAEAGKALNRPDWIDAAENVFHAIIDHFRDERLPHSILGDKASYPGLSSDYAALARAAVALSQATGKMAYATTATTLLKSLEDWHGDGQGGHWLTASDSSDVPLRIRGDTDEAIPSATSQILEALAATAGVLGDIELGERAVTAAELACGRIAGQAYGQAGIINASRLAMNPLKLVIVDEKAGALVSVANRMPDPRRVDMVILLGTVPDDSVLPTGMMPDTKKAGAYLCAGLHCLPVITDAAALEKALRPA